MINLITEQNAHKHRDLLSQMHRQRYRIFKEQLGWDVESVNGEERDEFDRSDTAYIVATDNSGRVEGSWRLLSTSKPYMASTVFLPLFDGHEPPVSNNVWECSRFAVDPAKRQITNAGVDATTVNLFVAIVEFAVTYGVREIVTVEDIIVSRLIQRAFGVRPFWRGSVHRLGKTRAVIARYAIDGALLLNLREKFKAPAPIIKQLAVWDIPEAA